MRLAIDQRTQKMVALKICRKSEMSFKHSESAHNERVIMNKLRHENIMRPFGCFEDHEYMLLIMNYMPFDLKTYMRCGATPK